MLEEQVKGAKLINKLVDNPNKLLGTLLVGNNIVNIGASALATSIAISNWGNAGVTISTVFMTLVVLIFGEITPKSLAAQHSEKVSLWVSPIINSIMFFLFPITKSVTLITDVLIRLIGGKPSGKQTLITEEELKTMIDVGHEEGILELDERQMIQNVFEFTDTQVKTIMVPRTDVCFLSHDSTYQEAIDVFRTEQYSRIPVYKESPDNIVGILNIKNLIFLEDPAMFVMDQCMIEPHFTYEFKKIKELLEEMRNKRARMVIVLDEYGGTAGVVTIEDLVEEIVGEIEDEYDDEEDQIQVIKEDEYIVDGNTKIDQINEMLGLNLESEDFDSIGGFVIGEIGHLPDINEILEYQQIKFEVLETNKNRIEKLKILT